MALPACEKRTKLCTVISVVVNIGVLIVFKYFNFFSDNILKLLSVFGWNVDIFTIKILLPIGISFYILQAVCYSIDVYKCTIVPERNLLTFASFMAFFPQLLAGPIERGADLLPQIRNRRLWNYDLAVNGAREILWGLFKKITVADVCNQYVNWIFEDCNSSQILLSLGVILYTIQIYCDFSGYCNIARGLAALLGIKLSINFKYPLFSRNIAEFWHRWHITLMTFFRDYVYIPMGGSRCSKIRLCLNILTVFLISGLWHGVSCNYLVWGALWGICMIVARLVGQKNYYKKSVAVLNYKDILKILSIFLLTTTTFIIFRFDNLSVSFNILRRTGPLLVLIFAVIYLLVLLFLSLRRYMLCIATIVALSIVVISGISNGVGYAVFVAIRMIMPVAVIAVFVTEWWGRRYSFALERIWTNSTSVRLVVYWLIILTIMISGTSGNDFIYYKF